MASQSTQRFPQLPTHEQISLVGYRFLAIGDPYLSKQVREAVIDKYKITQANQALKKTAKANEPAIVNYVSQVMAVFSAQKKLLHTGPNGGKHKNKLEPYYPTPLGIKTAKAALAAAQSPTEKPLRGIDLFDFETTLPKPGIQPAIETGEGASLGDSDETGSHAPPPGADDVPYCEKLVKTFQRDERLRQQILQRANGICEACGAPAPFTHCDGTLFLEVHHVRPLADGGPDRDHNALACCPNCHRELHHGNNRETRREDVIAKIARLIDHPARPEALEVFRPPAAEQSDHSVRRVRRDRAAASNATNFRRGSMKNLGGRNP